MAFCNRYLNTFIQLQQSISLDLFRVRNPHTTLVSCQKVEKRPKLGSGAVDRKPLRRTSLWESGIAAPKPNRPGIRTVAGAARASPNCARQEGGREESGSR